MGQVWSPPTVGGGKAAAATSIVDAELHSSNVDKPKVTLTVGVPVCARHEMSKDTNKGVVGQAARGLVNKVGIHHFKSVSAIVA